MTQAVSSSLAQAPTVSEIRSRIDRHSMSTYQWLIVGLCIFLNAQDGFDISAAAYSATGITQEWGISGAELGTIISAGLIGIVAGAFLLAPLADKWGRRPLIIFSLIVTTIGMFMGSLSESPWELIGWRFFTGLGIGAITACINVVATEFSTPKWRGMSIGLYTAGFGLGAALGGIAAASFLDNFGWRAIFMVGAVNSIVSIVFVIALLPESIEFKAKQVLRGNKRALRQLNTTLMKIKQPTVTSVTASQTDTDTVVSAARSVQALFSAKYLKPTLLLWAGFFSIMFAFYFVSGWTPRLAALAGHSESSAALAGSALALGGSVGAISFGLLSVRFQVPKVIIGFALVGGLSLFGMGLTMSFSPALLVFAFLAGFLTNGAIVGCFTLAPSLYSPDVRVTGVGWMNGVGRTGGILAPILIGSLLDSGWSIFLLYSLSGVLLLWMCLVIFGFQRIKRETY